MTAMEKGRFPSCGTAVAQSGVAMGSAFQSALDVKSMNAFQWQAVLICMVINMIDDFDVLVSAFTAAAISADWQLTGAQLGMLLSAGLIGTAAGSLPIAPWAGR